MIGHTTALPGGTTTRAIGLGVAVLAVAALLLGLLAGALGEPASGSPTGAPAVDPPAAPGLAPAAPAAPAVPDREAVASQHTVTAGETLAGIAQRTGVPVELLAADNGITDRDRVATGTVLDVSTPPSDVVVIAEGATLGGYAQQVGTTVDRLMALNPHLVDPDHIEAGDGLRITRG